MAKNGKIIQRSEYQGAVERNKENILANPELYKQRQALVEHPFGTMKRQWGFDHIMTKKTKARASADVGFIFIAYNLRRIINIIGKNKLMEYLEVCLASILVVKTTIKAYLRSILRINQLPDKIRNLEFLRTQTCQNYNFGILTQINSGF